MNSNLRASLVFLFLFHIFNNNRHTADCPCVIKLTAPALVSAKLLQFAQLARSLLICPQTRLA
jgi:hypothetical protein